MPVLLRSLQRKSLLLNLKESLFYFPWRVLCVSLTLSLWGWELNPGVRRRGDRGGWLYILEFLLPVAGLFLIFLIFISCEKRDFTGRFTFLQSDSYVCRLSLHVQFRVLFQVARSANLGLLLGSALALAFASSFSLTRGVFQRYIIIE